MKSDRRIGGWAAAVVALACATPAVAQVSVEQQLRRNQQQLEEIRRERDQLQADLAQIRGRVHNITSELSNLEGQKRVTGRIVNELDRQIGSMRGQLDTLTVELILTQDALAEKRAVLERRLAEIYKRGNLWTFQALLAAETFGDLLSRYKYLYLVSRQDRALVGEVEELRDRIATSRRELMNVRGELSRKRNERGQELSEFVRLERQRQQSLRRTRASEREAASRLLSLTRDEQRLNEIMESLEARRRTAVASGRRPAAPEAEGSIHTNDIGTLDWPVEGTILYGFGPQKLPNKSTIVRNGVGIGVPPGTPVRAIEAGTVAIVANLGTYGRSVIIEHGAGFFTTYLYLSRVDVVARQPVVKGTQIGLSGGENSDEGPHIEFQIRGEGAIALDPVNWLKTHRSGPQAGK